MDRDLRRVLKGCAVGAGAVLLIYLLGALNVLEFLSDASPRARIVLLAISPLLLVFEGAFELLVDRFRKNRDC